VFIQQQSGVGLCRNLNSCTILVQEIASTAASFLCLRSKSGQKDNGRQSNRQAAMKFPADRTLCG